MRNALLLAIAPTATIASIAGVYECIEPQVSNLFKRETLSGEFLQVNSYLVADLKRLGVWDSADPRGAARVQTARCGSFSWIPAELRELYRTAWELPQRALIDMAAARTAVPRPEPVAEPVPGDADHRQAQLDVRLRLEAGPEDHVLPALPPGDPDRPRRPVRAPRPCPSQQTAEAEAVACSLENPESCEACQ